MQFIGSDYAKRYSRIFSSSYEKRGFGSACNGYAIFRSRVTSQIHRSERDWRVNREKGARTVQRGCVSMGQLPDSSSPPSWVYLPANP